MSNKIASVDINGRKYELIKFGALKSVGIATKFGKLLAPMIAGGDAAGVLLGNLDDGFIEDQVVSLTSAITCNGLAINFDEHFAEFQEDLLPVVAFSLKENVMGFFTTSALESLGNLMSPAQD